MSIPALSLLFFSSAFATAERTSFASGLRTAWAKDRG